MNDLPEGFVLDAPTAPSATGLPEGFVLDQPGVAPKKETLGEVLTGPERYQTWPERLVRGVIGSVQSAVTAPYDAMTGKFDPESPEGTRRAIDMALLANPMSPGARIGSKYGAPPLPRDDRNVFQRIGGATPRGAGSGEQAAITAAEIGAPLPVGVASDKLSVQALTQAARQMPVGGAIIDRAAANTVEKAGESVSGLAGQLGASDRAGLGAGLRPALEGVVDRNKGLMNDSYNGVRSLIDSKVVSIPQNTKQVFDQIVARRTEARQVNPTAGLEQIENIVGKGVNFDGMVRAKSDLADTVDFLAAHGGFSNADKKQLGAAMSRDLAAIAARATSPGVGPEGVISALRGAEAQASKHIKANEAVQQLLANKRDEGLASTVLGSAADRTGNLRQLALLKRQLPKEDFEPIAGTALSELGHNRATDSFSLGKFATEWNKLNPRAKEMMFPGQHGKALDDIAQLGNFLKGGQQFAGHSNTARVAAWGALGYQTVHAAMEAAAGSFKPLLLLGGEAAGGLILAKSLASPAVSASYARFARATLDYAKEPSVMKASRMRLYGKDVVTNISSYTGLAQQDVMRRLTTAAPDQSQGSRPMSFDEPSQGVPQGVP